MRYGSKEFAISFRYAVRLQVGKFNNFYDAAVVNRFCYFLSNSNELINGGFKFVNPNAKSSCGCGKSFGV